MDIRWKDGAGNILNANNTNIKYLNAENNIKTVLKHDEVKKIVIENGLMNIFTDFENDLAISIIIPEGKNKAAVKIFNKYDKTGIVLKNGFGDIFEDIILESSMVAGNPFFGIAAFVFIGSILLLIMTGILSYLLGDLGIVISRILIIGYIAYKIISYITMRATRIRIKETKQN